MRNSKDQDRFKGALEKEDPTQEGNTSMQGQLGHRDQERIPISGMRTQDGRLFNS